jgi:hypothetical protein
VGAEDDRRVTSVVTHPVALRGEDGSERGVHRALLRAPHLARSAGGVVLPDVLVRRSVCQASCHRNAPARARRACVTYRLWG